MRAGVFVIKANFLNSGTEKVEITYLETTVLKTYERDHLKVEYSD